MPSSTPLPSLPPPLLSPPSPPSPPSLPPPAAGPEGNEHPVSTLPQRPSPQKEQHEQSRTESPYTVECHGVTWEENTRKTKIEMNSPKGRQRKITWRMTTPSGSMIFQGCEEGKTMSRLDYFLLMFPPKQLKKMVKYTDERLKQNGGEELSKSELLKFLGLCILITRFQFSSRRNLWSTTATSKYVPAFRLGQLSGMSRCRFDEIWSCLRWSYQPEERPDDMMHATYRWMLVDGFVDRFNAHRASKFFPGRYVCIDESMIRWYGHGGGWINRGLPHYIAIDRKPENGLEVQNAACGDSGIMIQLKLVKGESDNDDIDNDKNQDNVPHGAKVARRET